MLILMTPDSAVSSPLTLIWIVFPSIKSWIQYAWDYLVKIQFWHIVLLSPHEISTGTLNFKPRQQILFMRNRLMQALVTFFSNLHNLQWKGILLWPTHSGPYVCGSSCLWDPSVEFCSGACEGPWQTLL